MQTQTMIKLGYIDSLFNGIDAADIIINKASLSAKTF